MASTDFEATGATDDTPITVLCVDDEPDYLTLVETAFDARDQFRVLVETDPSKALNRLANVDCVVSDFCMPEVDGLEFLEAVRKEVPTLPFVLHIISDLCDVADGSLAAPYTDCVQKDWHDAQITLLGRRIKLLVERRRFAEWSCQYRAAVKMSRDLTLITNPDGNIAYANRRLSSEFTTDRGELLGRS